MLFFMILTDDANNLVVFSLKRVFKMTIEMYKCKVLSTDVCQTPPILSFVKCSLFLSIITFDRHKKNASFILTKHFFVHANCGTRPNAILIFSSASCIKVSGRLPILFRS